MKILNLLQPKLDIKEENLPEFESIIENVKGILRQHNIHFNENSQIAFYAHIINYIRRLKEHEYLNLEYGEIRKEIDQDVYEIAEKIVEMISQKYDSKFEVPEVLLIAIHIQTTRVKSKG